MDPAEYKHVVLGLIFLKYISDTFEEKREKLQLFTTNPSSDLYVKEPTLRYEVLEDRDEYLAENIFWVPSEARWSTAVCTVIDPPLPWGMLLTKKTSWQALVCLWCWAVQLPCKPL